MDLPVVLPMTCTATYQSPWMHGRTCDNRARWWVDIGADPRAMCGVHANVWAPWGTRWPLVTGDPLEDRALAEGVFR